jgi:hypothetical protein
MKVPSDSSNQSTSKYASRELPRIPIFEFWNLTKTHLQHPTQMPSESWLMWGLLPLGAQCLQHQLCMCLALHQRRLAYRVKPSVFGNDPTRHNVCTDFCIYLRSQMVVPAPVRSGLGLHQSAVLQIAASLAPQHSTSLNIRAEST